MSESIELGDEMYDGSVLVSKCPPHFMVVGVGIAMHGLPLVVVHNGGAIGH